MKKNIVMKALALAVTVVALTGCADKGTEAISASLKDNAQVIETVSSNVVDEIKEAGTDITANDISKSLAVKLSETAVASTDMTESAETAISAVKADKSDDNPVTEAKPKSASASAKDTSASAEPAFECLCGFVANTEDELWEHILNETLGSGVEVQIAGAQPSGSQPSRTPSSGNQSSGNQSSGAPSSGSQSFGTSSSGSQSQATQPPASQHTAPAEPGHTHVWKEHTATTQTWVPNIVIVDDYEVKRVYVSSTYICTGCGFATSDMGAMDNHMYESLSNGGGCGGFGIEDHYDEQQVKVGSHEEDQGHYETSTYVDYYYCDCGATK